MKHEKVSSHDIGCQWDNTNYTPLLRGLFLGEYFLKYSHKSLQKNLDFFFYAISQGLCKIFQEICHFQKL
jgi:hypothetical protein